MTTAAAQAGIGSGLVSYGYVMDGTTLAACTNSPIIPTLWTSPTFTGARYQHMAIITLTGITTPAGISATENVLQEISESGVNSLYTAGGITIQAFVMDGPSSIPAGIEGITGNTNAQNFWWDFAQTNVFMGQTQFGRGGGTGSPCGYWVFYALEQPGPRASSADSTSTLNKQDQSSNANVNLWTDNAITNTVGAFVLAGVASLLY